ncbi:MAG: flocculation-associated PEP-CTERM protein PepA, partial [Gammaproteobacteria bacterium]|nr:flocculation-associated PEP-CTERM protein PepA [Gammaproteobacteria bacterium]
SGAPISGTGLNSAFNMYALFQATGTQVITGSVVELAFTTFDVSFYIDQNRDTAFNNVTIGGTTTTITDESILFSNTAFRSDDVEILSGSLSVGGGHIFGGLANGDFDVLFNVNYFDPTVWGGAAFTNGSSILGDFNGVNTRIEGVALPGTNFVDGLVVGSGNTSFQVPAPATLMLFSIGLLGLGGASRRRNSHSS